MDGARALTGGVAREQPRFLHGQLVLDFGGIGLMLLVWTVNHPEKARPLWELPVDGITTDTPDLLLEAMSGSRGL